MGNVASVDKAIRHLGHESLITNDSKEINDSDCIILPGVGAFAQGMENLNKLGLTELLNIAVIENKKPFLGICLGMQLIATKGYEPYPTNGLGWNEITVKNNSFLNEFDQKDFYFIHSYHFSVKKSEDIAATVNYGNTYVAAIQKDNIFASQFHPEKSQSSGLSLIKMFLNLYA